jgi:hypothetical protein
MLVLYQLLDQLGPMGLHQTNSGVDYLLAAVYLAQYFESGQRHHTGIRFTLAVVTIIRLLVEPAEERAPNAASAWIPNEIQRPNAKTNAYANTQRRSDCQHGERSTGTLSPLHRKYTDLTKLTTHVNIV